ncbi:MAG: SIS domain-containing protein [Anaerolineales bacterium]|jgi:glucosamine--fructose-6-phosphate aminotransferase (isomerizing)
MTSLLLEEIREQPEILRTFLREERSHVREIADDLSRRLITCVIIAARGSSDNAATYGRYLLESRARWPVSLAAPSLFTLYRQPPNLRGALIIGISQSGESQDVLEVVAEGRRQGAATLAITNVEGSPMAREAEHVLLCRARIEQSIAATKTYTAELYALAWLATEVAGDGEGERQLQELPDRHEQSLAVETLIRERAERYRYARHLVVVGRGFNYATAYEIALKLKELTYTIAEPYSSADFRHGPIAIVEPGFPVIVIAPSGLALEDVGSLARELRERKAELLVISDRDEILSLAQVPLRLPDGIQEWVSPIVAVVPGQFLAAYLALAKGLDPDQPRALRKITITR